MQINEIRHNEISLKEIQKKSKCVKTMVYFVNLISMTGHHGQVFIFQT